MIKFRRNGEGLDLAEEYIGKKLIDKEIKRAGKQYDKRLKQRDLDELGPAGAMRVFSLGAFGEDADREGYNDLRDFRGYDSQYVEEENGAVITNLYGKVLVGPLDAADLAIDREGAIRFSCQAELGMAKKVNCKNGKRNLVVVPKTVTPTYTGRRIYIRPK
jgi:hypothetical protein